MRVLRAHGVPGLRRGRLQGERHLLTWKGLGSSKTHSPLARGQSSQQLEMRRLQEKLFLSRVPFRVPLRVVRHDGNTSLILRCNVIPLHPIYTQRGVQRSSGWLPS